MHQHFCKECQIRSLQFRTCLWLNSHKSLEELQELILNRNSILVRESLDGSNNIFVNFPFKVDINKLLYLRKVISGKPVQLQKLSFQVEKTKPTLRFP